MHELRAARIVKVFSRRRVVDGVSLSLRQGEVVGLLGPNGAGKTTIFNLIVGQVAPDGGDIWFDDRRITDLPMYRRARLGIGYLPQEPSVFRRLTVEQNISAILEILKLSKGERRERLSALLRELDIGHLAKAKAYTLSGGERRRVEITRALVTDPAFLLLDEPLAGIDPITVADIQGIIARLKARNIGVLITDHNVRDTLEITDRAYIIYDGKILVEGTPPQIVQHTRVREVFLGEKFARGDVSPL